MIGFDYYTINVIYMMIIPIKIDSTQDQWVECFSFGRL